MLNWLLQLDDAQQVAGVHLFFRGSWLLALALAIAAVAVVVYLYRSDARVPRTRRYVMAALQALALLVLVVVVAKPAADIELIEPYQRTMLVLVDTICDNERGARFGGTICVNSEDQSTAATILRVSRTSKSAGVGRGDK